MNSIQDLLIQIDASSELLRAELRKANAGIDQFERNTNAQLSRVNNSFGALGRTAGVLKSSLAGLAAGFAVGFVQQGAKSILDFADDLATAANQTNVSVERFQTLRDAFRALEVPAEQFQKILAKLIQAQGDVASGASTAATKALDRLGVSADVLSGKISTTDELLDAIAKAMGRISDPAQKAAIAADLVGARLGVQFAAAIGDGGAALQKLEQQFRDTGSVIDSDYIERLAEANEAWDSFVTRVQQRAVIFAGSVIKAFQEAGKQIEGFRLIANEKGFFAALGATGNDALAARTKADIDQLQALGKEYQTARRALANVESGVIKASDAAVDNLRKKIIDLERQLGKFGLLPAARPAPAAAGTGFGQSAGSRRASRRDAASTPAATRQLTPAEQRLGADPAQIDTISLAASEALVDLEKLNLELIRIDDLSKVAGVSMRGIFDDELLLRVDNTVISLAEDLGRSLADLSIYGGDLGDVLESTFKRMAAAVLEATIQTQVLLPLLKSLGVATGGGGGGGSLLGNLFGSFLSAFGGFRETGGAVQRGRSYVVGERGPELFVPNAGGRIMNNAASRAALAGGPTEVNVNIEPSPLFIATVQRSTAEAAQNYVKSVQRQRLPAAIGQGR